jgi:gliding motility-associated-like protein
MKYLLLLVTFLSTGLINAQAPICLGNDTTICLNNSITIVNCLGLNQPGAQAIILDNPTSVSLTDDSWSNAVNIGFDFNVYGSNYTQCVIGSNGLISFDLSEANGYCSWALGGAGTMPNPGFDDALQAFMPAYQDINPSLGGQILYQTVGTAPNRMFIVLYLDINFFSCTSVCNYISIILKEGSNQMESHIGDKPLCSSWNGGLAIQGSQNGNGSAAHITPGRNNSQWAANQEGKRWTPTSPTNTNDYTIDDIPYNLVTSPNTTFQWEDTDGNTYPYNGGEIDFTSTQLGTTGFFISGSACGASLGAVSDTSWISVANPTVNVSSSDDICSQGVGSVTATPGTSSPPPYTYSWPALGASSQTVNNVIAGTYSVFMTDGNGCSGSATIIVGDSPANFSGTTTLVSCSGGTDGTATAIMDPSDGTETYLWNDGQTTQTAVGLSTGAYSCEVATPTGCLGTVNVTVDEIPAIVLAITDQQDALCNSDNSGMAVIGVTQGSAPYTFSWDNSSSIDSIATDLSAGIHNIIVMDLNGCSDQISLTISEPDPLSISDLTPDSIVCAEAYIDIQATGNGGSSPYIYTWTANGNSLDLGQTITVNPTENNTLYCLTLSEECGSPEVSECLNVTFPTAIIPEIIANNPIQCLPGEFTFFNNSSNGAEVYTTEYLFSSGDVVLANGTEDIQLTLPNPGIYDLDVNIISNYGCLYTAQFNEIVEVTPLPTANFNISQNPVTWFETEIQTSETSMGNIVDYVWISPGSTNLINNGGAAIIDYPEGETGTYPITLVVTTNEGCSDSLTLEVEVVPDIIFYAPNSFTPDDDEHNQTWSIVVEGIDEMNFTMEIFNRWGETVWKSNDINAEWDGTYGGIVVPEGSYIWRASYKERNNDGKQIHVGYVNVIR